MQSGSAVNGLCRDRPRAKARRRGDGAAEPPPERRKPASRLMGMDVLVTAHDPWIAPEPYDRASRAPAEMRPAQPARFAAFAALPLPPASPVCDFWAVSQAEPTRNAAWRRRFPRSAIPTANNPRRKPPRSPGPMAKSAPISCKTVQKSQGTGPRTTRGSRQEPVGP